MNYLKLYNSHEEMEKALGSEEIFNDEVSSYPVINVCKPNENNNIHVHWGDDDRTIVYKLGNFGYSQYCDLCFIVASSFPFDWIDVNGVLITEENIDTINSDDVYVVRPGDRVGREGFYSIIVRNIYATIKAHLKEGVTELITDESGDYFTFLSNNESSSERLCNVRIPKQLKYIGQYVFDGEMVRDLYMIDYLDFKSIDDMLQTVDEEYALKKGKLNQEYGVDVYVTTLYINGKEFDERNQAGLREIYVKSGYTSDQLGNLRQIENVDSIVLENGITTIPASMCRDCINLKQITIPNTVSIISGNAFTHCFNLSGVTLPDSLTSLGGNVFFGTNISSIYIPKNVSQMSSGASGAPFANMPNLSSITVDPQNSTFDSRGDCNAIIVTSTNTLVAGCNTTVIPNSVVKLESRAFSGSNIEEVVIPSSVTVVSSACFVGCTKLRRVVFPNTVQRIMPTVFSGCVSLEEIHTSSAMTATNGITSTAFNAAKKHPKIFFTNPSAPGLNANWATNIPNCEIIVPSGSVRTYCTAAAFTAKATQITCEIDDSETPVTVTNTAQASSAGLQTALAGQTLSSIKKLKINGTINGYDLGYLTGLTSLVYLDLEDATVVANNYVYQTITVGSKTYSAQTAANTVNTAFIPPYIPHLKFPKNTTTFQQYCLYGTNVHNVVIPSGTTTIKAYAFNSTSSITSVVFEEGFNGVLEGSIFAYCSCLKTVQLANSMTALTNYCFQGCEGIENITMPANITALSIGVFAGCTSLSSVTIPSNSKISEIRDVAFEGCCSLSSITIPNKVTKIAYQAFKDCSGLTSIIIPSSVTQFGTSVFEGCTNIESFIFEDNSQTSSLQSGFFSSMNKLKNVKLPTGIKRIPQGCFGNCVNLEEIEIPPSVSGVETYAFQNCYALKTIKGGEGILSAGTYVFSGCKSLERVDVGFNMSILPNSTFAGCSSLKSFTIPDYVTYINPSVFYNSGLRDIIIPSGVTGISGNIFSQSYALSSITVDDGNQYYDSRNNCNALIETSTNTLIAGCSTTVIPNGVVTIAQAAFYYQYMLPRINIPDSVTGIGASAFYNCFMLKEVTFGTGLTSISGYAFESCNSLRVIDLSNSPVTTIGDDAFALNDEIRYATFPSTVTTIGKDIFLQCHTIVSLTCLATTPPSAGSGMFRNINTDFKIYVPAASVDAYKAAANWSAYANKIEPIQ